MKRHFNTYTRVSAVVLILSIGLYGSVYVMQACCSTEVTACIPVFNGVSDNYYNLGAPAILSSHQSNIQLQSYLCSKNVLTRSRTESTCCETNPCESYLRVTEFSLSYIKDFISAQGIAISYEDGNDRQTPVESYNGLTFLKAVPIYFLTQSLLC
jgi:hypothetical protein